MSYLEKFIASVISGGKILREYRESGMDCVYLPFSSEYALKFKNLHSERAAVSVSIDGIDVLNHYQVIINPNESHTLNGFMNNGIVTNAFRFIEKTKEISDYRGDKQDDGIIRIEFQFERPLATQYVTLDRYVEPAIYGNRRCGGIRGQRVYSDEPSISYCATNNEGITVKGSQKNIKYANTVLRELEPTKHVLLFNIKGTDSKNSVLTKKISTKEKIVCPTCGKSNKSFNKFCGICGTCLI